jgi:hypothetical protein
MKQDKTMKTSRSIILIFMLSAAGFPASAFAQLQPQSADTQQDEILLSIMHSISSHVLLSHVTELASEKYQGRLTGTAGFNRAAQWTADLFKQWKIKPLGDNGTYFQEFPNPYTLVLGSGEVTLRIPAGRSDTIRKSYKYEEDYFPGSTSDAASTTANVLYVGYGITAPELNYDDYNGMNVKGKIVMFEPEVPVGPDQPELFKRWRPYSFHDYKMKNAFAHGAAGVLYNYHIVNPNCVFIKGLIIHYVGRNVINDMFAGTGRVRDTLVQVIRRTHQPRSFDTGKTVTITCVTEHHPGGIGMNILGWIEGSDSVLKSEVIILGAHLDHVGMNHLLMPGANDNASGDAVLLGIAEALSRRSGTLKRSVLFILFGAEEQGVKGSEYYVAHPMVPNAQVKAFINLESIGRGEKIDVGAGKNYPKLLDVVDRANARFIHRVVTSSFNANLARPRQDAAHFLWAGIPTIGIGTYGAQPLSVATYHTTQDKAEYITPEILEDVARLMFLTVVDLAR